MCKRDLLHTAYRFVNAPEIRWAIAPLISSATNALENCWAIAPLISSATNALENCWAIAPLISYATNALENCLAVALLISTAGVGQIDSLHTWTVLLSIDLAAHKHV